jgi:hypothetical protein
VDARGTSPWAFGPRVKFGHDHISHISYCTIVLIFTSTRMCSPADMSVRPAPIEARVTFSSSAALLKLGCRTAASNESAALMGERSAFLGMRYSKPKSQKSRLSDHSINTIWNVGSETSRLPFVRNKATRQSG